MTGYIDITAELMTEVLKGWDGKSRAFRVIEDAIPVDAEFAGMKPDMEHDRIRIFFLSDSVEPRQYLPKLTAVEVPEKPQDGC